VSPKLVEQIRFGLDQIRQLLAESREIIEESKSQALTPANRWALGAVLRAFHNGVENILKRVSAAYDGKPEKDGQWHIDLLTQMRESTVKRDSVISGNLLNILKKYLAFRHLFRSIYKHELKWELMAELVLGLENAADVFESEIRRFCASIEKGKA
jgi:hypothetical protein